MLKLDMAINKYNETINGTVFRGDGGILPTLENTSGVLQLICFVPQLSKAVIEVPVSCVGHAIIFDTADTDTVADGTRSVTLGAGIYIFYGFRPDPRTVMDYWYYKRLI